jgi:hypothetical protein
VLDAVLGIFLKCTYPVFSLSNGIEILDHGRIYKLVVHPPEKKGSLGDYDVHPELVPSQMVLYHCLVEQM